MYDNCFDYGEQSNKHKAIEIHLHIQVSHIEMIFSAITSQGAFNNNSTAKQSRDLFKTNLIISFC